ncbi:MULTISPECIES: hypothetical protein [unclassified Ensifer]|uniref:hypothetical protein n=1 Tax=unclassified Ensifer TaxID=2633371 RepID=UPI0007127B58|nr:MULTISPECIES: hypothetical protein [unclassified Ensifer]KQX43225.1 hypothetical protein ASD49_11245 [Ensifer sp. Root1298]KQX72774.1 hypothetical protein ASD41_11745 [Ensifer sp. Root1312]KRC15740.1 hypothetical protein ASE29_11300 [Ensifer sp. Root74]KRD59015.1 hypothetical protein ASE71_09375 [Ensifer sp. Root954]
MSIRPPTYKDKPYPIQFAEMAADWVRGNDDYKARGAKRNLDLPNVLLDTAIRAGKTHSEIRSALGISSNTLSKAIKRAGLIMPKTAAQRTAFLESPPITSQQSSAVALPHAKGMVAAWVADLEVSSTEDAQVAAMKVEHVPASKPGSDATRTKPRTPRMAEAIAKRMIGEAADRLIPGTYTGRDGHEHCDGLVGRGPEARPTIYAWREKASEVEEVLKIYREIHAEGSSATSAHSEALKS